MEGSNNAMSDVITALTTALNTVKTDFMTALGGVLPIALAIAGAGMVIVLAMRIFKKVKNA